MPKLTVHQPVIVAQSTTEPVLFGGYQDPKILCSEQGVLYCKFSGRKDCVETLGHEDKNPVYRSCDQGKTWEISNDNEWIMAHPKLLNGDRLYMCEHKVITDYSNLPDIQSKRKKSDTSKYASVNFGITYTVKELEPVLGNKVEKCFNAYRVLAGTSKIVEEKCAIKWDNMPVHLEKNNFIWRVYAESKYKIDKNGTMWMPVFGGAINQNGELESPKLCTHLLRSDDCGHNWVYVSTVLYKSEYNFPQCADWVEGFNESTVEIFDNGSIVLIMRSGSLFPFCDGKVGYPIPQAYIAISNNNGKTWDSVKPFYQYGIRPNSVKLKDETIVMISGRPGVYIRACFDRKGNEWEDPIHLLKVNKNDIYNAYYEYTCSNCDIAKYDQNTAFVVYSNFKLKTANGERAKSIIAQKITLS